ncbi:MAG: BrnA antitoxin family protein [Betaproteobacteria bacterium]|nr:BrnA antitoxin family protein [Betaproteobacteria bacterium]
MPATSDDAPKLRQKDFDRAHYRVGEKDVSRQDWQAAVRTRVEKKRINIMLDLPIVEHFKVLAGERGYQTLINETLRRAVEGENTEADLRRILREELKKAAV